MGDADRACSQALDAWGPLRFDASRRAGLLEGIAAALDSARAGIIAEAAAETALTPDELAPEFARMTGTLRLFARTIRDPAWTRPLVEPASEQSVGPGHALRKSLVPLGPVAVFGASNFPFAYGVCGGDTASALAAGCPVVVKEHPAHPRTGRLIAGIMRSAIEAAGYPAGVLGYIQNEDAKDLAPAAVLVTHPAIRAVGFTGSVGGGLAIEKLARSRRLPIPVFAEMGSTNPVIVTQSAAETRGREIGELLAASILSRFGQQCTCPGIIVVPMPAGAGLVETLAARLAAAPVRDMLAPWVRDSYVKRLDECRAARGVHLRASPASRALGEPGSRRAAAALLSMSAEDFAAQPILHDEIFGPAALIVEVRDDAAALALPLPNALTGSLFFDPTRDAELARALAARLSDIAGRIIFNGVPTGVRVSAAMVHGGPYPASNRPDTTAVGPLALERWCRPVCWQGSETGPE